MERLLCLWLIQNFDQCSQMFVCFSENLILVKEEYQVVWNLTLRDQSIVVLPQKLRPAIEVARSDHCETGRWRCSRMN